LAIEGNEHKQHLPQLDGPPFCSRAQDVSRQLFNGKKLAFWTHDFLLFGLEAAIYNGRAEV
jgi:hypothetical protein